MSVRPRLEPVRSQRALADRGAESGAGNAAAVERHPAEELASAAARAVVTLDFERLALAGCLRPDEVRSPMAEEFRRIKRPLLSNAFRSDAVAQRLGLIMITSAMPGEGKTFCAINLAMSIASEIDTSVLLVDADIVQPSLLQRLGVRPTKGLLDLLADPQLDPAEMILTTNVPKLSILSAGTPRPNSAELLASGAMDRLLVSLAEQTADRVVIFDSPPLLMTNEAQVLAYQLGQVVLVVEASHTPRNLVEQALALIEGCPTVMSLLNMSDRPALPSGYGYGYGYGGPPPTARPGQQD